LKSSININIKIISALWAGLILFLLIFSVKSINEMDLRSGEQWKNYYSVFTTDALAVEKFLRDEGLPFISLNNSKVLYNDITSLKSVALKNVNERFSTLDPRLDPYMKSAARLFTAHNEEISYSILYIERNSISLTLLYAELLMAFRNDGIDWSISGFKPVNQYLPLLAFLISSAGFLLFTPLNRWKTAIALSGWIPFVVLSGIPALALSVSLSFFIVKRKSPVYSFVSILLVLIFTYYSSNLNILYIQSLLFGVFGITLLLFEKNTLVENPSGRAGSRRWKEKKVLFKKPEHQLFSPVQIMAPLSKNVSVAGNNNNSLLYLVIATMLVICGISAVNTSPDIYTVPLLQEFPALSWTLEDTESTVVEGSILSPADYITHMAFQEGFLYGSEWTYPHQKNPLLYPVYMSDDKIISKEYEIIADYSELWFKNRISMLKSDNPAKLLFSTDHPGFVIKKPNHQIYQLFTLLQLTFSVLLLLLIISSNGKKYINISFIVRKKLLRRNEQVA